MVPLGIVRDVVHRVSERLRLPGSPVVVSFPKSGRTQLRVMLHAAGVRAAFSHAGSSDEHGREAYELAHGPNYWRRCRVLFMIRNPLDTAVSAWFHARYRSGMYQGDLPAFLRDPRFGFEKIIHFHLLWLEARARFRGFTVLEYEALQADAAAEFRRAGAFLTGGALDDASVGRAVEAGRFDNMRQLELSGAGAELFGSRLSPRRHGGPEGYKTRRGVVGGWRDYLDAADIAFAEALASKVDYGARLAAAGVIAACWPENPGADGA